MIPWLSPSGQVRLGKDEVHVWRATLSQPPSLVRSLEQSLDDEERARAVRFHFDRDRVRYVVARATLRAILGHYLTTDPRALRFRYRAHGKPYLSPAHGAQQLSFNVAHAHELALIAVTRAREIGIDIERTSREREVEQIAQRFFSANEFGALGALPSEERQRAFFACWTRKEACVKASGLGLSLALNQFDVPVTPLAHAVFVSACGLDQQSTGWWLYDLHPAHDSAAALAVADRPVSVRCWEWEPATMARGSP
jgi:4'-phosphopantetheinyl transferase